MDYAELLKKYMQLIISYEGQTYLDWGKGIVSSEHPEFTKEEAIELNRISDEVRKTRTLT